MFGGLLLGPHLEGEAVPYWILLAGLLGLCGPLSNGYSLERNLLYFA